MDALVEEALLDGNQQVIGENAEKDVSLDAMLELVEDGSLAQRALHVAEGVFDAGQQDIEAPRLLGRQVFAIGLQQVGAVEAKGTLLFLVIFLPIQRLLGFAVLHPPIAGYARVALLDSAEGFIHLVGALQLARCDASSQPGEVGQQTLFLLETDGLIFGLSTFTQAQDVEMLGRLGPFDPDPGFLLRRIARRGLTDQFVPVRLLFELIEPGLPLALSAGHQIVVPTRPDLGQVVLRGHAAVDDYRGATAAPATLFELAQHLFERGAILTVALEDLMRLGKPISIQDQAHDDLLAVRSLVSRVAALGLRVFQALPFEVGRCQVVEVVGVIEVEQAFLALGQLALDTLPVRVQAIQVAVQRLVAQLAQIDAQNIAQGRMPNPLGHGVLRAWRDETVEHHHFAQQARPRRKADLLEDLSQTQSLPDLMANVHRPSFARLLQTDLIGVHRHDVVGSWGRQARAGRADPLHDTFHQRIGILQRELPLQRRLDPIRQAQPLLPRPRRQVAQRADRLLPWPLRRPHRLYQQIGAVGPAVVSLDRLADEHGDLYSRDPGAAFSSLQAPNQATSHLESVTCERCSH